MTDDSTETPAEQSAEQAAGITDGPAPDDSSNAEAARYRRRLRDTETERDGLAQRLATAQRREVERLTGDVLHHPADLWAAGVDLDDLRDEDGNVDAERVTEAVDGLREVRSHWFKPQPSQATSLPTPALRLGATPPGDETKTSWSGLFKDAASRPRS